MEDLMSKISSQTTRCGSLYSFTKSALLMLPNGSGISRRRWRIRWRSAFSAKPASLKAITYLYLGSRPCAWPPRTSLSSI
jgi:hypothetical protein